MTNKFIPLTPAIPEGYQTISLEFLKQKGFLKDRLDHKYFFPDTLVERIFETCQRDYHLLQIGGHTQFTYHTWYFDTRKLDSYFDHHRGKCRRYKLRFRHYLESGVNYLELKIKNNKGRTHKERKQVVGDPVSFRLEAHQEYLMDTFGLSAADFVPSLRVTYKRSTLLHESHQEKVTVDWDLEFEHENKKVTVPGVAVAEVKTPRATRPQFDEVMRSLRIREGGLSKYILGSIALKPGLKYNSFKPEYRRILRLHQTNGYGLHLRTPHLE